jgi:hypothetical protein
VSGESTYVLQLFHPDGTRSFGLLAVIAVPRTGGRVVVVASAESYAESWPAYQLYQAVRVDQSAGSSYCISF